VDLSFTLQTTQLCAQKNASCHRCCMWTESQEWWNVCLVLLQRHTNSTVLTSLSSVDLVSTSTWVGDISGTLLISFTRTLVQRDNNLTECSNFCILTVFKAFYKGDNIGSLSAIVCEVSLLLLYALIYHVACLLSWLLNCYSGRLCW